VYESPDMVPAARGAPRPALRVPEYRGGSLLHSRRRRL